MANGPGDLGRRGEDAAARWLTSRGWSVLGHRWRDGSGELDLVCLDPGGVLVGVEVKARSTGRAGYGAESLTYRRVRRLRSAIVAYASRHGARAAGTRLDLVELTRVRPGCWRLRHVKRIDGW
jgi:putative endonuclease